jgi:hypothetical protein
MQKLFFIFFTAAFIILPAFWHGQINFSNTAIVKKYLTHPVLSDSTLQNKNVFISSAKPDSTKLDNKVNNTGNSVAKLKLQLKPSFDVLKENKIDTVPKKHRKPEMQLNTYAHL